MARKGKIKSHQAIEGESIRPSHYRKYEYHILIVCEDENTEPEYFGRFKTLFDQLLPNKTVYLFAKGTGRNSLGVVNSAIQTRSKLEKEENLTFEQTWVVFDKDDLDLSPGNRANFEEAFRLSGSEDIEVAFSNECFELWLLLHFVNVADDVAIPRKKLYAMIESVINDRHDSFRYEHGNVSILDYVEKYGNESMAIRRAEALDIHQNNKGIAPIDMNPSTRVYRLVKELRAWYRYYSFEP